MNHELHKDYELAKDSWGFCSSWSIGLRGDHGPRHTAEEVIARSKHRTMPLVRVNEIITTMRKCEPVDGYMKRNPDGTGPHNSHDNIRGGLIIDLFLNTGYAKRFVDAKWKSRFCGILPYYYDDKNPGKSGCRGGSYQGRFHDLLGQAQMTLGDTPSAFQLQVIAQVFELSLKDNSQDGLMFAFFLATTIQYRGIDRLIPYANSWSDRFEEKWPGGAGEVLKAYFGNNGQPSIKWLDKNFGRKGDQ